MSTTGTATHPPGSVSVADLTRLDIRVGRILEAAPLKGARRPAYRLRLDLGREGERSSSAQITRLYPDPEALICRLVVVVVNLPPRRVAGFASQVLVLGAVDETGAVRLLSVDAGAEPGQPVA